MRSRRACNSAVRLPVTDRLPSFEWEPPVTASHADYISGRAEFQITELGANLGGSADERADRSCSHAQYGFHRESGRFAIWSKKKTLLYKDCIMPAYALDSDNLFFSHTHS